jgi:SAM-dependent methyltransferase
MTQKDSITDSVLAEYASLAPLEVRIATHQRYSEAPNDPDGAVMRLSGLPSAASLIDIGSGTGAFLRRINTAGHTGRLVGVDTSPAAVEAAAAIPGVTGILTSAESLPVNSLSFDLVTARHMLYHVPDPVSALREFGRVVVPGGRVVVVVNHSETLPKTLQLVREIVREHGLNADETGINDVHSDSLPGMMKGVFGNVEVTRFDNALVFRESDPLIAFAIAVLSFCGVSAESQERGAIASSIAQRVRAWFAGEGRVWRDPKGYTICASRIS